ncbi:TIGR00730 family Rossman fold protein [Rhizobacter sp. AJA081-3]|uniref:LOG family protein n=1 Tax=Rhizobacter sp. AJA081-3 TaxID=2753607 RepID=UPI001AE017CD|nr:TIGR00730 family Rossman fold protein [Rhizobacter sp. AJA081-3]QTN25418.1 TIGR00730 family Rossman fold protein [Rhizobacter sp. AJA081-3]
MSGRVSLCIYCGSRTGDNAAYEAAATTVGTAIGCRGWRLVYGGGRAGLMGRVADAALAAGAQVLGVIPRSLMEREVGHRGLTELHVVETMHERKLMMAEHSDAFIALPGGIGTFEELFEVWTWRQLGYHDKPVGLLNVDGYYDALLDFMRQTVEHGFVSDLQHALLQVQTQPEALLDAIARLTPLATEPDDYRRI